MKRRAFISVSNKDGVVEFAKQLSALDYEIVSTGGTEKILKDNGVDVINVSEITSFPECLDGRVKTLHPAVHAGILAMRSNKEHMQQLEKLSIVPIDIVAVNLYPFKQTISKEGVSFEEAIENIDIGGPTMLRAAAKNNADVAVVVDALDYHNIIEEIKADGNVTEKTKRALALKVFEHTAAYDALIADYLRKQSESALPDDLTLTYEKQQEMRYGENPHQKASFYREINPPSYSLAVAEQLNGKELSFNNINDTNGALELLREFKEDTGKIAVVAVKHANPCGVALKENVYDAYQSAHDTDPVSIYGGIVVTNGIVDEKTAKSMNETFLEIVVAPDYTEAGLNTLKEKKNLRVLRLPGIFDLKREDALDMKKVMGGLLVQDVDNKLFSEEGLKTATKTQPTEMQLEDMKIAWKIVKHVKSNAIAVVKDGVSVGIGPGQVNRIWAVEHSIERAGEDVKGAALASDAYFPFDDSVTAAAKAGITSIIQPGGSIRDEQSIKAADDAGIAMVFTGMRHFKH